MPRTVEAEPDADPESAPVEVPVETADAVDEDELDAVWGFSPEAPIVGHGAPPVVAVVIAKDPGDWFEDTLRSLGDQDYESLSILVIDNGGAVEPTPRIAEVLPTAYVKRLDEDAGFSAAANESLTAVEGSAFHLILHDDVRLAPDTVTSLVAEAFRANAGIVGPKLVDWDDPRRLVSVGYSVDAYGFAASISEPGELDQSQHDTPHEVFAVSDACLLIRSDLFRTVGGFADEMPFFGQDVDLCWRAHVAGATVQLCPGAAVAHRNRFSDRRLAENGERLALRHEARMMLANYELLHVLRVLPAVFVLSGIDLIGSAVLGQFRRASDIVASWTWNLVNLPSLIRARSRTKRVRRTHDSDYRPLMRQGSSRLISLMRIEESENRLHSAAEAGRGYLRQFTDGSGRAALWLAVVATALVLVGARDLFTGPLPVIRELVDPGDSRSRLVAEWWSAWRDAGLGESAVPPASVPGLGLLGMVLFGSIGLARRLLILAPVLVGALGAWKLFVRSGSVRARAAALVAYGLNPLILNALAEGRLGTIVTYGAAPWVLRRCARVAGIAPFGSGDEPAAPRLRSLAGTALVLAWVCSITVLGAGVLVVAVVVLSLAAVVSGERPAAARMAGHAVGAGLLAAAVNAPWVVGALASGEWSALTGLWVGRGATPSAAELVTGSIGPVGVGVFGWGLVVAAGYGLVAGRSWRLGWSIAGWVVAFAGWVTAILLARVDLVASAGVGLVLVPSVLGLTVSVAMGALAFDHDVVGADFGLSQLLAGVGALALVVGLVPIGVAAADGRWYQPEGDFRRILRVVDSGTDFRTVWVGDPDVLPLAGWPLGGIEGVAVAANSGLDPTITDRYHQDGGPGRDALDDALAAALRGETTRLGRLLAPMGVRYLIAVDRSAPQPFESSEVPLPEGALSALREQLDLEEIPINEAVALFRVSAAWPLRSDLGGTGLPEDGSLDLSEQLQTPLQTPEAVLDASAGPGTRFSGRIDPEGAVGVATNDVDGWSLEIDGASAERERLLGWAQQYRDPGSGEAVLAWRTPVTARLLQGLQVVLLLLLLVIASRRHRLVARGRRRSHSERPIVVLGEPGDGADSAELARAGEPAAAGPTDGSPEGRAADDEPPGGGPPGGAPDGGAGR